MRERLTKYANTRVSHAGRSFASKLEAAVFDMLVMMERAGLVKDIVQQPHVKLTRAEVVYIPDFKCFDVEKEETFWVEAKGAESPEYRIKRRLWKEYGPGPLYVYKGTWQRPKLFEIIIPVGNNNE